MSQLNVTLIDVGWGDSILIEWGDGWDTRYALIDSNDTSTLRSSHIFLRRFFERKGIRFPTDDPLFDWVLLSHVHADHGQGLQGLVRQFGAKQIWYPKSAHNPLFFSSLLRHANRKGIQHQAIDNSKAMPALGAVQLSVLWPPPDLLPDNENDNSIVLVLELGDSSVVLTGDAEGDVWNQIADRIPANTRFFKLPHHGSRNGFYHNGAPAWLGQMPAGVRLGISSHIRPFSHPHPEVIDDLDHSGLSYWRTDRDYHLTFTTDGQQSSIKYSHT